MKKLLVIIGTRPELIKLAPIILRLKELGRRDRLIVVNTSQHKDLIDPLWSIFQIEFDYQLDIMISNQSLAKLTSRGLSQFQEYIDILDGQNVKLSGVLAQGDTSSVMISSLISFYNNIPFLHLEAGLRSFDLQNPYPEELNRKIASIIADVHFAPTMQSKKNLINEGVKKKSIVVSGNTVVDSLNYFVKTNSLSSLTSLDQEFYLKNKIVLITCHRRENYANIKEIINSIEELAKENPNYIFIWPTHPNPNVKTPVMDSGLSKIDNVIITDPLNYIDLLFVLSNSLLVITDSGGIQEEAPSFKVPVLIIRETTERPEGVKDGISFLVGSKKNKIKDMFYLVINDQIRFNKNPYGDGKSSIIISDFILNNYM